jgi:hypothetical protein
MNRKLRKKKERVLIITDMSEFFQVENNYHFWTKAPLSSKVTPAYYSTHLMAS